ncbi:helix-turn-helix domain-containing protein [Actinomadura sp. 9N407]|uniref:helix-turn-helix domain-containing protein n=1 Tax=Actinomadura sp. 9N407 TaxID=3375154 RepID=UPI0037AF000D
MLLREQLDARADLWALLAVYLHFLRTRHGLSCAAVGELTGCARQTVSHWESGVRKPSEWQLAVLDERYGTGELLRSVLYHAKRNHDSNWFKSHLKYERRSSEQRIWDLSWIPGLFQTPEYARAVFEAFGVEDVDEALATRLRRQAVLEDKPLIWLFLDQGAIEQPVGSSEIMRGQLAYLLRIAQLPNITVRIVPRSAGPHPGRAGPFKIMTVGREDLVYVEACGGGRLVEDNSEVRSFRVRFDRIGDWALPVDASMALIKELMARFE